METAALGTPIEKLGAPDLVFRLPFMTMPPKKTKQPAKKQPQPKPKTKKPVEKAARQIERAVVAKENKQRNSQKQNMQPNQRLDPAALAFTQALFDPFKYPAARLPAPFRTMTATLNATQDWSPAIINDNDGVTSFMGFLVQSFTAAMIRPLTVSTGGGAAWTWGGGSTPPYQSTLLANSVRYRPTAIGLYLQNFAALLNRGYEAWIGLITTYNSTAQVTPPAQLSDVTSTPGLRRLDLASSVLSRDSKTVWIPVDLDAFQWRNPSDTSSSISEVDVASTAILFIAKFNTGGTAPAITARIATAVEYLPLPSLSNNTNLDCAVGDTGRIADLLRHPVHNAPSEAAPGNEQDQISWSQAMARWLSSQASAIDALQKTVKWIGSGFGFLGSNRLYAKHYSLVAEMYDCLDKYPPGHIKYVQFMASYTRRLKAIHFPGSGEDQKTDEPDSPVLEMDDPPVVRSSARSTSRGPGQRS